tara:strand:- start:3502 stop:3915 length:414 start_codon:yes stop_codon:yes gene_type:complete
MALTKAQLQAKAEWEQKLPGYTQTFGKLRESQSFCCLGVACDIFDKTKWKEDGFYDSLGDMLPHYVAQHFGMSMSAAQGLAKINDMGVAFTRIVAVLQFDSNYSRLEEIGNNGSSVGIPALIGRLLNDVQHYLGINP